MLGFCFCVRAFSSCGERGPLFIAVRGPLTIAASLVAEHRFQTRRLSSCASRAQLLCGMWDLPRPGLEPVSPALAGRFSTAAPPGKPQISFLKPVFCYLQLQSSWFKHHLVEQFCLTKRCIYSLTYWLGPCYIPSAMLAVRDLAMNSTDVDLPSSSL